MNELSNTVTSVGTFNSMTASLTSNTSLVTMISGLTLEKTADKQVWASGPLAYTITITNQTDIPYLNITLTDKLDTTYINFVDGSLTINEITATNEQYSYNSGTLNISLDQVAAKTVTTIRFRVTKKS